MYFNYLKIAYRNIFRNKLFSFINILGLTLGIITVVFIFLFVMEELSYDRFHSKADQTYMIRHNYFMADQNYDWHETAVPLAEMMRQEFPEVENISSTSVPFNYSYKHNDRAIDDIMTMHADNQFFEIFDFKLLAGNPESLLNDPNAIVISENTAQKLFSGHSNELFDAALGEILKVENESFIISGIMENPPKNSHLKFEAVLSIHSLVNDEYRKGTWLPAGIVNYVELKEGASLNSINSKFKNIEEEYLWPQFQKHLGSSISRMQNDRISYGYYLEPILDIHLVREGNLKYVIIFSVAGVLILLIGLINYINLFIASVNNRIKEVGVRKVLGAGKRELIKQFFIESALLCVIAFSIALVTVLLVRVPFNNFSGTEISFELFHNPLNWFYLFALLLIIISLSSSYPAFYLSSVKTISSLKGKISKNYGKGKLSIQKPFIVFQYAVSIGLMVCFLALFQQLKFMQEKNPGFEKENVLVIPGAYSLGTNKDVFKENLLSLSSVQSVSFSYAVPGSTFDALSLFKKEGEDKEHQFYWMNADYDYLKTYNIEVVEGRGFSEKFPSDANAILLNEEAAQLMGKEDLIGTTLINHFGNKVKVVGVVKNFNFEHLKNEVKPLAIALSGETTGDNLVSVKLSPGNPQEAIAAIENYWTIINQGSSFQFTFLDDKLNNLYQTEERVGKIISLFTGLAILITCFGLIGMITFTTIQRTKEIGIRKVLGATVTEITFLLSKDFLFLVVIAFVIAAPISYFLMELWLQDFANRISLGSDIFILAGSFIFIFSSLAILYQILKSARSNPVDSLNVE